MIAPAPEVLAIGGMAFIAAYGLVTYAAGRLRRTRRAGTPQHA